LRTLDIILKDTNNYIEDIVGIRVEIIYIYIFKLGVVGKYGRKKIGAEKKILLRK
jgi:hypothetical protein